MRRARELGEVRRLRAIAEARENAIWTQFVKKLTLIPPAIETMVVGMQAVREAAMTIRLQMAAFREAQQATVSVTVREAS